MCLRVCKSESEGESNQGSVFTLLSFLSFSFSPSLSDRCVWMSEPFDYLDLKEIGDRVKCMDIVSLSQGNLFSFFSLLLFLYINFFF